MKKSTKKPKNKKKSLKVISDPKSGFVIASLKNELLLLNIIAWKNWILELVAYTLVTIAVEMY